MSYSMDQETRRGYNIPDDYRGYAVIQHGYACLGIGATEEAALEDARAACGGETIPDEDLVWRDCDRQEGSIEVVEVC